MTFPFVHSIRKCIVIFCSSTVRPYRTVGAWNVSHSEATCVEAQRRLCPRLHRRCQREEKVDSGSWQSTHEELASHSTVDVGGAALRKAIKNRRHRWMHVSSIGITAQCSGFLSLDDIKEDMLEHETLSTASTVDQPVTMASICASFTPNRNWRSIQKGPSRLSTVCA